MTIVEKEVTRKKESTRTVTTCDVCGLSEVELRDDEDIDNIRSGPNKTFIYNLHIRKFESVDNETEEIVDEWVEEYYTIQEAQDRLVALDMDYHTVAKDMEIEMSWELDIDVCTHCQGMLFGGTIEGNFTSYESV